MTRSGREKGPAQSDDPFSRGEIADARLAGGEGHEFGAAQVELNRLGREEPPIVVGLGKTGLLPETHRALGTGQGERPPQHGIDSPCLAAGSARNDRTEIEVEKDAVGGDVDDGRPRGSGQGSLRRLRRGEEFHLGAAAAERLRDETASFAAPGKGARSTRRARAIPLRATVASPRRGTADAFSGFGDPPASGCP